jgi:hypothetical protein
LFAWQLATCSCSTHLQVKVFHIILPQAQQQRAQLILIKARACELPRFRRQSLHPTPHPALASEQKQLSGLSTTHASKTKVMVGRAK